MLHFSYTQKGGVFLYKKFESLKKSTYKTGEVAKLLGITIPTVIRYCKLGLILYHKTESGHRRVLATDVCVYLDKHKHAL